jgi:hypothetical protein
MGLKCQRPEPREGFRPPDFILEREKGFEPCPRGWKNLKQDAPLPTIPSIFLGFLIPSRPTLSHLIPPDSAPEG